MSTLDCTTFTSSLIGCDFRMSSPYFLWEVGDVVCLGSVFRDCPDGELRVLPVLYVPDILTDESKRKIDAICSTREPDRAVPLDYFLSSGSLLSRRDG